MRAIYNIELHNKGGKFNTIPFTGTRTECRARCKELQKEQDCGTAIKFLRYVNDD